MQVIVESNVIDDDEMDNKPEDDNGDSQEAKESNGSKWNDSEAGYESDSEDDEIELDDIDNMLENGLDIEQLKSGVKRGRDQVPQYEEKQRIVLVKPKQDHFDILPEGWIEIVHSSGMPLYLHRKSRVCTLARPYYLGNGPARKHGIPFSAVPCLHYRKFRQSNSVDSDEKKMDVEETSQDNTAQAAQEPSSSNRVERPHESSTNEQQPEAVTDSKEASQVESSNKDITALTKVETFEQNRKQKTLSADDLRDYCARLFEFKTLTTLKFRTWSDRRKHSQLRRQTERRTLPESTKLITCKVDVNNGTKINKKEFVLNPTGKSSICILHEYLQRVGRTKPEYVLQEVDNVIKPYCATVTINGVEHGTGYGANKKEAKDEAARATLELLIPNLNLEGNNQSDLANELSLFQTITIEDDRIAELCEKSGQHSPYQILVECLRRHHGIADETRIETDVKLLKRQKNEYTMRVAGQEAKVICRNKHDGKQRAAQAILQKLHPLLQDWAALIALYGRGSYKTPREKRQAEREITELQNHASQNSPNYAILNKLKEEMLKLRDDDDRKVRSFGSVQSASASAQCPISHIQLRVIQEFKDSADE